MLEYLGGVVDPGEGLVGSHHGRQVGKAGDGVVTPRSLVPTFFFNVHLLFLSQFVAQVFCDIIQGLFLHAILAICVSRISRTLCFCHFGTEFSENLRGFGRKNSYMVLFLAIFGENVEKYPVLELSFLAKTGFFEDFWYLSS